mgnify:CR=1 FL=1
MLNVILALLCVGLFLACFSRNERQEFYLVVLVQSLFEALLNAVTYMFKE